MPENAQLVCIDYETNMLEFYRHDFQVISCAFGWKEGEERKFLYVTGEEAVGEIIKLLSSRQTPILVHNHQFEYGVTKYRYGVDLNWYADTMRVMQVYDNGGKNYDDGGAIDKKKKGTKNDVTGFRLVRCAKRVLPSLYHDHKEPYHAWIRANIPDVKPGKEGSHLHKLPPKMLEAYNVADVDITMRIYETCLEHFAKIKYNWKFDHKYYLTMSKNISNAKGWGINVNRELLTTNMTTVREEIAMVKTAFFSEFAEPILAVEALQKDKFLAKYKSEKGRIKAENTQQAKWAFNLGSNTQLEKLFVTVLQMPFEFKSPKGKPSFKSAFLGQWGRGGEILGKRRKRLLVLKQMEALLNISSYDNKFHPDMKVTGTKTGRMAAGSI
jgi:hypothetical protein